MAISPGGRPADASPLGKKPGGPRGLTDYIREVSHALMRRGVPKSKAIAIARSQQAKWAAKSKNPAIRAASAASLAEQHVLDHRKRGRRDMSRAFEVGGPSIVDLDWTAFNAQRPKGQPRQAKAKPAPAPDLLSAQTHSNIAAFQKAHGLAPSGQLDAGTVAYLNSPKNAGAVKKAASGSGKPKLTKQQRAAAAKAKRVHAAIKKANRGRVKADRARVANKAKAGKAAGTYATHNAGLAGGPVRTSNLAVPIVASDDGPRVTSQYAQAVRLEHARRQRRAKRRAKK